MRNQRHAVFGRIGQQRAHIGAVFRKGDTIRRHIDPPIAQAQPVRQALSQRIPQTGGGLGVDQRVRRQARTAQCRAGLFEGCILRRLALPDTAGEKRQRIHIERIVNCLVTPTVPTPHSCPIVIY
jgi:hypothetical protein